MVWENIISGIDIDTICTALFSAIFTMAAISGTIITIVSGSLKERYIGIPIQVFATFKSYKYKPMVFVVTSLLLVLLSLPGLFLSEFISLVILLFIEVALISLFTIKMWKLVSDQNFCQKLLKKEIEENHLKNWNIIIHDIFSYCLFCVKEQNKNEIENAIHILNLLKDRVDEEGISDIINQNMTTISQELLSPESIKCFGITDLVKLWSVCKIDVTDLIIDAAKSVLSMDDQDLSLYMYKTVSSVLYEKDLDAKEKFFYLFNVGKNICNNRILSEDRRIKHINSYIENICYSWNNNDEVQVNVLINIFEELVLKNEKWDEALVVHDAIIRALSSNNIVYKDSVKCTMLAYIFALEYSYGFNEKETIKEEHRKKIQSLIKRQINDTVDIVTSSLSLLIEQNIQNFLIALRSLADNPSRYGDHEYYSNSRVAKYAVWDDNNLTALLYCTYFANHIYYSESIYQTENWNSLDSQEKKLILSSFVNLFNKETYELNDDIYEYIKEIAEWASFEHFYGKDHFVSLFKEANKELKDINKTIIDNKEKNGAFSIETFKSDSPFYDSNPKEEYCKKEVNINFEQNDVNKISIKDLQGFAYEYCKQVLNYEINTFFEKVPLSFDSTGVNEILKVIKDNNIVMSNYKYIDDISFSAETRESGEFIELCNLMNGIKIVKDSNINKRIMCNTTMPKYNFSIGRIKRKQLNDLAVEEVCRALLISDNKYVINDAVYDKKEAMEYVKKNYRQDSVKIVIKHNFDKNKFFVLSYKNKRG